VTRGNVSGRALGRIVAHLQSQKDEIEGRGEEERFLERQHQRASLELGDLVVGDADDAEATASDIEG
jgi:hypothetical protein